VLKYLARYTHRVAISNRRLLRLENGQVTFSWKDYAHGNRQSTTTLEATEFIRRFLLHVLPSSFVKIRYYGFMANRGRKKNLSRCRQLLGDPQVVEAAEHPEHSQPATEPNGELTKFRCPVCQQGCMRIISRFERQRGPTGRSLACPSPVPFPDTS
jgi:hypothetical protein